MKVKDAVRISEKDGWYLAKTRGSHRQFKHPSKTGKVTVAGKLSKEIPVGTLKSILRQAQLDEEL